MTVRGAERQFARGRRRSSFQITEDVFLRNARQRQRCCRKSRTVAGRAKVLVDGGIRSGADIFKAIALGADGVLIARPFVTAVYGGGTKSRKDVYCPSAPRA